MSIDRLAIIAYLTGEADPAERRQVEVWRAADAANEEEFGRISRLWRAVGDLEGPVTMTGPSAGQIVALAKTRGRGSSVGSIPTEPADLSPDPAPDLAPAPPVERGRTWSVRLGLREVMIAAALIAGVALGFSVIDLREETEYGQQQLVTGLGESATVTLNDGTVVRVGPESRIAFPRSGRSREVSLQGRAYFTVTKDEGRPFVVNLPDGQITVLGTRFEVAAGEDSVQVAVVEGRVRLSTRGQAVGLAAKQIAHARGPAGRLEVEEIDDVFEVVDWLGRFLAFESTPMNEVVNEIERRFGMRIEVADSSLLERHVTGWFADQSAEQVIAGICAAIDAQCTIGESGVRIDSRSITGG